MGERPRQLGRGALVPRGAPLPAGPREGLGHRLPPGAPGERLSPHREPRDPRQPRRGLLQSRGRRTRAAPLHPRIGRRGRQVQGRRLGPVRSGHRGPGRAAGRGDLRPPEGRVARDRRRGAGPAAGHPAPAALEPGHRRPPGVDAARTVRRRGRLPVALAPGRPLGARAPRGAADVPARHALRSPGAALEPALPNLPHARRRGDHALGAARPGALPRLRRGIWTRPRRPHRGRLLGAPRAAAGPAPPVLHRGRGPAAPRVRPARGDPGT